MGSLSTWNENLTAALRLSVPCLLMALFLLLSAIAMPFPVAGHIKPPLLLIAIYYWSVFRPTLVPFWFVFVLGVIMDFIGGLPIGLHALTYLALTWIVRDQRRFLLAQPFAVIWLVFVFVAFAALHAQWALFGATQWQWGALQPVWWSIGLSIAFFPVIYFILYLVHRILPTPSMPITLRSKK